MATFGDGTGQAGYGVRFEWGVAGVEALARPGGVVVVVDVLRFTTAVEAAASRGVRVFPQRWDDGSPAGFAAGVGAVVADGAQGRPSLSPVSLLTLPPGSRVVLPSPNGATCAAVAAEAGAIVVAACLRNAAAVTAWLRANATSVAVIACGERWADGSLRPALEDLLGAGAVITGLDGVRSPEAQAAVAAWSDAAGRVTEAVVASASGRELLARGWDQDLRYALQVNASTAVPVLRQGAFVDASH